MEKYLHLERSVNGGIQKLFKFDNNYGASVVKHAHSYGGTSGKWEIAVIQFDGDDWGITYDTYITSDVIGHLSDEDVEDTLRLIQAL